MLYMPPVPRPPSRPKSYLGIYFGTGNAAEPFPSCKERIFIKVAGIIGGSPADEAGLADEDIILTLDGMPTCEKTGNILPAFREAIRQRVPGSVARLQVLRNGEKLALDVRLSEMPVRRQAEANHPAPICPGPQSALENALRSGRHLSLFSAVQEELSQRANVIHNPGKEYAAAADALQLKEMTYMMRHPLDAGRAAMELSLQFTVSSGGDLWPGELIRRSAGLLDIELPLAQKPGEVTFAELIRRMEEAGKSLESSFSRLSPDERRLLRENALNPWEDRDWDAIAGLSLKTSRAEIFQALSPLLAFLNQDDLLQLKEDIIRRFGRGKGPVLFEAATPMGRVIVGGTGSNLYQEDAALILDLGGDDIYLNNAGGTRQGMPVSLVIDWDGNDRYLGGENFSQGAGLLGGGFLVDLGGSDTFVALDGSQGVGFWGIGLLYHGGGSSTYQGRNLCQGVGQMGIGMITTRGGDDRYGCLNKGQALGLFGGAGILTDRQGDDLYQLGGSEADFRDPLKATVSLGQGLGEGIRPKKGSAGVPGGIGMLLDEKGNDLYIADYFAQGAAYYYGVGVLNDLAGDDQYIAGRYAQGAGIHSSVGVLLDQGGNDLYYASFGVAQGMGHDFGIGFLEDRSGDDRYLGGVLAQAAATNGSIGVLTDSEGKDLYWCRERGQGFAEEADSLAIMIATEPSADRKQEAGDGVFIRLGVRHSDQ
jgi:hypothetical protein